MSREKPITGHRKLKLLRLLAAGEHSYEELGRMFDSSPNTITQFKYVHKEEIKEIQQNLDDEFAGLWIVKKHNRVAEYASQVERIGDSDDPKLIARAQTALRSVAEELGDLPSRTTVSVDPLTVNYKVEGTDPEAMK